VELVEPGPAVVGGAQGRGAGVRQSLRLKIVTRIIRLRDIRSLSKAVSQDFPSVSISLVPALPWCQHIPGVSIFLMSAFVRFLG
jgi:hypothetical protein